MSVRNPNRASGPTLRRLELRLLLLCLLIVTTGMGLVVFGKLAEITPPGPGAVNINVVSSSMLAQVLSVDHKTAIALVKYRSTFPSHQFPSTFRLRRAPALRGIAVVWDSEQFYVRTSKDVEAICFAYIALLMIVVLAMHVLVRRLVPLADPFLLPVTFLLSGLGLMVSISVHDPLRDTFAFGAQAAGVAVYGPVALLIPLTARFRRLPLHRYTYFYAACAVFLLVTLFTFGRGPAGTHIQMLGFEPIEVIKVLLVFFVAAYLADRRMSQGDSQRQRSYLPPLRDVLPLLAIYVFALSLFGAVKDLGPAVLLFGSFLAMLYLVTGQSVYPVIGIVLLLIAGYFGDTLGIGFFATRVEMWLSPWNNTDRLGGQLAQGLWGLGTGGLFGSGLGLGGSYFVPRAGSDMAFTTIGEDLGLVGALCILTLYVVIILRGFQIAARAYDDFDRLLAAGITVLIGLQSLVIAGGATGLIPLTGITLPFVSYGTSSLVMSFFCVGVLLNLSAKSRGGDVVISAPPVYARSARRVVTVLVAGLLLFVGGVRLIWLQGIVSDDTATRTLWIPDADHVYRYHRNPRLVGYAAGIPRGSIRDRNGVLLAGNAPPGQGVLFLTGGVPRMYPLGSTGANIVEAVEQEESAMNPLGSDRALRGYNSLRDLLPLYNRKDLPFPTTPSGKDVTLTVDIGLQRAAERALASAADRYGNGCGAAVVLNARTGALLAAATVPTFDPNALTTDSWNRMHTAADTSQELLDRAFAGTYVPGSVFKIVTATASFNEGKSSLHFTCAHTLPALHWKFNGRRYVRRGIVDDEEFLPHGDVDLAKAIRVSCNVYFARLGVALGAEAIERSIHAYQLLECPSLQELGSDLPDCAYGQGTVLVTPYEMAKVCQSIANSGRLAPSTFVLNGETPTPSTRIMSIPDAKRLGAMMADVVTDGTAAGAFPGLSVAGKTGSAQMASGKPHSWFVGFAPVAHPSIAFACIVEHGGHGRIAAASVSRAIVHSANE